MAHEAHIATTTDVVDLLDDLKVYQVGPLRALASVITTGSYPHDDGGEQLAAMVFAVEERFREIYARIVDMLKEARSNPLARGVYRAGPPGPDGEQLLYAVDHRGLMIDWRFVQGHRADLARVAIRQLWASLDALDPVDTEEEAGGKVSTVDTREGRDGVEKFTTRTDTEDTEDVPSVATVATSDGRDGGGA